MISSEVKRILVAPLVITVVLSAGLVWNPRAAYSALLGGTIGLIANSYAAWRIFSRGKGVSADYELYNFYRAEIGKLVVIGALCGMTFLAVKSLHIAAFLGGLVAAMVAGLIAAATHKTQM